jgi:DNA processing protein
VLCLPLLWVVGPRKMSSYAQEVLKNLFDELKKYEIATVSWMAPGVDSLCHELSISYGIPTIAVLWWGLWYFLKSNKRHMIDKIVYHDGLVLSEFKLWQSPTKRSYPQRNRIIAWLGQCLFVPEAKVGSGSLITVENALSIHKPVYGAPQSLFAINSQWLLQYMESGKVKLVLDLASFLHDEFWNFKKQWVTPTHVIPREDLTKKQKTLCSLLQSNSLAIHQLTEKLWWEVKELMAELTVLEIMQVVGEDLGVYSLVK